MLRVFIRYLKWGMKGDRSVFWWTRTRSFTFLGLWGSISPERGNWFPRVILLDYTRESHASSRGIVPGWGSEGTLQKQQVLTVQCWRCGDIVTLPLLDFLLSPLGACLSYLLARIGRGGGRLGQSSVLLCFGHYHPPQWLHFNLFMLFF